MIKWIYFAAKDNQEPIKEWDNFSEAMYWMEQNATNDVHLWKTNWTTVRLVARGNEIRKDCDE